MIADVKIQNGDVVLDSGGRFVRIFGVDAKFQRAMICINTKVGGFVYNRKLGSQIKSVDIANPFAKERLELLINEALAHFENTKAEVVSVGKMALIQITIDGETRTEEVRLCGNIRGNLSENEE